MPGGDRTGPAGMGAMTGRGAGCCSGSPVPGYANPVPGRGFWGWGGGRGRGRGRRHRYYATGVPGWQRAGRGAAGSVAGRGREVPYAAAFESSTASREHEIQVLKRQAEDLTVTLDDIRSRIEQLEAEPPVPEK
jgi:hypothetical protein